MTSRLSSLLSFTLLFAVLALIFAVPAVAEDVAAADESGDETMFALIKRGGWLMWPIAICSLVALTIAFERLISLRKIKTTPAGVLQEVFRRLPTCRASRADRQACAEMLTRDPSILARVLRAGVLKLNRGAKNVEKHLTEAVSKELHLLKRRLRPFSIVASVSPLLGLLGTVYGMIKCFSEAHATESAQRTQVLAEGIYGALVTTATGLTVAIPALLLYHYFLGCVDRTVDQLEESATELLDRYYDDEDEDENESSTHGKAAHAKPSPISEAVETKN